MMKAWLLLVFVFTAHLLAGQSFVKKTYFDEEQLKLKEIITLSSKDSTLEGRYQSFFQNGSLASAGYYRLNQPDSLWIFHFENGHVKTTGKYRMGKQVDLWKYYFENGNKKATGMLSNDTKNGHWTFYYENGKEKSDGLFIKDKKEGIWNYYYEDGLLKAQAFYQNGRGTYKEFYPTGTLRMEGINADDKSEGIWTYYYESGEREATGSYQNGLRQGPWLYYHKNGQLAAEGSFENGEKQGVWTYYFDDGTIRSEGEMVSDQKDGFWKLYYQSGLIKGEGKYDEGTGEYIEYYENGKQKAKGQYVAGKKEGPWVYYSEDGLEDGKATFINGVGQYKGYYPDGSLKMEGLLNDDRREGEWTLYHPDGSVAGVYRPVYEDEKPIFRTAESIKLEAEKTHSDKPEYRYKNNKIRYFQPRMGEFTGVIVGTNPLWTLLGRWPVAFEYYLQERLGFEGQITFYKDPFFQKTQLNKLDTRGGIIELRQKFYQYDSPTGMVYFGHQITAGYLLHQVNKLDSSVFGIPPVKINLQAGESRIGYGLLIGNRWMQRTSESGFTVDFHLGLSVTRRFYNPKYEPTDLNTSLFRKTDQNAVIFPIIFGINIGYAGPKRRTSTF